MTAFLSHFYSRKHHTLMKSISTIINDYFFFFSEGQCKSGLSLKHSSSINAPKCWKQHWKKKKMDKERAGRERWRQNLTDPRRRAGFADPDRWSAASQPRCHRHTNNSHLSFPTETAPKESSTSSSKAGMWLCHHPFSTTSTFIFPNESFMQINA